MSSNSNHDDDDEEAKMITASLEAMKATQEEWSEEHVKQQKKEINKQMRQAGLGGLPGTTPDVPDEPPCDHCAKDFSGKFACSRCNCAFYCSKECQKAAWRSHKLKCETIKEISEKAAQHLVNVLKDPEATPLEKVRDGIWENVDYAGPYKMALSFGLNDAIKQLLEDEIANGESRLKGGTIISYTQHLMCVLFRNDRCIPGSTFSKVDAYRIKKYVLSSDDAFEKWFEASMVMVKFYCDYAVRAYQTGNQSFYWAIQQTVRGIVAAWTMVWTNPEASTAILLGKSKTVSSEAHTRAKWIVMQIRNVICKFWNVDQPDGAAIEGQLNTFTAMIEIRCQEYSIEISNGNNTTFADELRLKGMQRRMYLDMGHAFAAATIKKGRTLTTAETQAALAQRSRSLKTTASNNTPSSTGGGNKKKKGKKGRK